MNIVRLKIIRSVLSRCSCPEYIIIAEYGLIAEYGSATVHIPVTYAGNSLL